MTAHVRITPGPGYGTIRTICTPCNLDDPHPRWKPAHTAAHTHNRDHHGWPQ